MSYYVCRNALLVSWLRRWRQTCVCCSRKFFYCVRGGINLLFLPPPPAIPRGGDCRVGLLPCGSPLTLPCTTPRRSVRGKALRGAQLFVSISYSLFQFFFNCFQLLFISIFFLNYHFFDLVPFTFTSRSFISSPSPDLHVGS